MNAAKRAVYNTWSGMRQRCLNPKCEGYSRYGGRGIKICKRWLDSFQNFFNDMGAKPSPDLTIERLDNDGNYTPSNCVWATRSQQSRNRWHPKMGDPFSIRVILEKSERGRLRKLAKRYGRTIEDAAQILIESSLPLYLRNPKRAEEIMRQNIHKPWEHV